MSFRLLRTRALAAGTAWCCLSAVAGAQSPSPPAPQSEGGALSIYLMTMGQGDEIWEKFGHNAIGVRDARDGSDIVYNWGMFSFAQPGFIPRFLRGRMMYWMAPFDAAQTVLGYIGLNRTINIQELNLEPDERVALRDYLAWNAREENKFYRYDYFRDNCSTRVRDALDRVLHGVLRRQLESVSTTLSYRDHSLRLTQGDILISTGIDIGLGRPTDRHLTAWEEGFIPMMLRDRLRHVTVPRAGRGDVPLVRAERTVFLSTRPVEAAMPANRAPWFFLASATVGLIVVILSMRATRGLRWARVLTVSWVVLWSVTAGLLGTLLALLWGVTEHVAAHENVNLFHFQPLWLAVAIASVVAFRHSTPGADRPSARVARLTGIVSGVLSVAGFLALALPMLRQGYGAPVALAAPLNIAAAFAVTRLYPRSTVRG